MLYLLMFLYSRTLSLCLVRSDSYRRPTRSPHVSCGLKLFFFTFVFVSLVGLVTIPFAKAQEDPLPDNLPPENVI